MSPVPADRVSVAGLGRIYPSSIVAATSPVRGDQAGGAAVAPASAPPAAPSSAVELERAADARHDYERGYCDVDETT